jgi:hypothetical protein
VSEDEKREETEVEAHKTRLIARNDEPADEPKRSGDDDDDSVEAHKTRASG